MDPLSLTASIIAVAQLAAATCAAISDLRALCKSLPGRLHAVNNEVADLELVLSEVALLLKERSILPDSGDSSIPHLLKQARTQLDEVKAIVHRLTVAYAKTRLPLVGANAWRKEQGPLQALQNDIRTVKSSLNLMLGASNSQDMLKIRLEIQEITTFTAQSTQEHLELTTNLITSITGVNERVARIEEMMEAQALQLRENQFTQVGAAYARRRKSQSGKKDTPVVAPPIDGVAISVRPYAVSCRKGCPCACHSQKRSSTPQFLNTLLGRLFVSYAGLPVLTPKCDDDECRGSRASQASMEYWFPLGVWSTIIRMQIGYRANYGPSFSLETLRRIPDTAQCVEYAVDGNIAGLQHLFKMGLASPRDVSSGRGYSLLRWALYAKQYEACEFLVNIGADADYRPIAESDNSPRIKACHFLLEGSLPDKALSAMRTITRGSEYLDDYIDDSKFTKTLKIVLGLSLQNLQEELIAHPEDINIQDTMGRTALAWAAARGDKHSVATLLAYGADPNITDVQLSGPLSNAAAQNHTACVELLLKAGADPDPPLPDGVKKGNPLNVAARNAKDPVILKRLLDFGADVNQVNAENKTPLFHAARNDNVSFVMLLLEYNADINAMSTSGETALTTAITYNSHNVLRLLLERWHEYTTCPRLRGPNLVKVAALYGDCETFTILAATEHFRTKSDRQYTLGDFKTLLRQRADVTEKLIIAFDELLTVINMAADTEKKADGGFLKSGLFSCITSRSNTFEDGYVRDDDSDGESSDMFEDALEKVPDIEVV